MHDERPYVVYWDRFAEDQWQTKEEDYTYTECVPVTQNQTERIEQDRLPPPRLPGKHAEPAREIEIERFDKDNVADRKPGQHGTQRLA